MPLCIRMLDEKGGYLAAGRDFPLIRVDDAVNAELFDTADALWRWLISLPEEVGSKLDGRPYEVMEVTLDLAGVTREQLDNAIEWSRKRGRPVKEPARPRRAVP